MPSHVALLRGINVGGRNRVAMADLRAVAASLGWADVATYLQSGNLVFSASGADPAELAGSLERAVGDRLGLRPAVVVVSRDELARVVADNPYPDETNPKAVHAVFRADRLTSEQVAAVAAAQERARQRGSRDQARVVGRTLFLHTPDGLGRSELASQLDRADARAVMANGTARNWATVTALLAKCDG